MGSTQKQHNQRKPGWNNFIRKVYQTFKGTLKSIILKFFQKIEEVEKFSDLFIEAILY